MDPPGRTDAAHRGRIFPEDCGKRRVVCGATQTHGAHFYILDPFFFFFFRLGSDSGSLRVLESPEAHLSFWLWYLANCG